MDTSSDESRPEGDISGEKHDGIVSDPKPKFCLGCEHESKPITDSPCWCCKGDRYEIKP
jgi:hypothetical protein